MVLGLFLFRFLFPTRGGHSIVDDRRITKALLAEILFSSVPIKLRHIPLNSKHRALSFPHMSAADMRPRIRSSATERTVAGWSPWKSPLTARSRSSRICSSSPRARAVCRVLLCTSNWWSLRAFACSTCRNEITSNSICSSARFLRQITFSIIIRRRLSLLSPSSEKRPTSSVWLLVRRALMIPCSLVVRCR